MTCYPMGPAETAGVPGRTKDHLIYEGLVVGVVDWGKGLGFGDVRVWDPPEAGTRAARSVRVVSG